jgi:hypothetical protein
MPGGATVGRARKLLTGDSAMLLKARSMGLDVMLVPESWMLASAGQEDD